jgi:hypothetical protein
MSNSVETAKKVLTANTAVLYGIFGTIESSGYFPPSKFLNQFLAQGNDPCDQDGRMSKWPPFTLSALFLGRLGLEALEFARSIVPLLERSSPRPYFRGAY